MQDEIVTLLRIYNWPSEAFWRYFEFRALKELHYDRPVLEIGCGSGQFSAMLFDEIDDAIDINSRAVERARLLAGRPYHQVRCADARDLQPVDGAYGTVFANCVMEHIPSIREVLAGCFRSLRPGGRLVISVPLEEMNHHLLFPWPWYARMRQKQLVHVNLFTAQGWERLLEEIGFSKIEFRPYLSGAACKFWDTVDGPACLGFSRYRLAAALSLMARKLLPARTKRWILEKLAHWLTRKVNNGLGAAPEAACATVVIACRPLSGSAS